MRKGIVRILSDNRGMGRTGMIILVVVSLLAAGALGSFLGYTLSKTGMDFAISEVFEKPFNGMPVVRILILGEDNTGVKEGRGLSDTIILASFDFEKNHVAALSIPRDTRVDLNGYGRYAKINSAYSQGGPTETARIRASLWRAGWRCSTTAPPPSSTIASPAAGRAA